MKKNVTHLGIKKIREIEFFIDEEVYIDSEININIGFELKTNIDTKEKTVELLLSVIYSEPNQERLFLKFKTSNLFFVPDINDFKKNKQFESIEFPDSLLTTMLSLSVTHTRALLAKASCGSKFADYYLPVVNPAELAKKLFVSL